LLHDPADQGVDEICGIHDALAPQLFFEAVDERIDQLVGEDSADETGDPSLGIG
jgi:hypothetical protein